MAWRPEMMHRSGFGFLVLLMIFGLLLSGSIALAEGHESGFADELRKKIVTDAQRENLLQLNANGAGGRRSAYVIFNRNNGTPSFIKVRSSSKEVGGSASLISNTAEENARQFLMRNSQLLKMSDPDKELALERSWSDNQGASHFRFQQMVEEIPVFGRQLLVHANSRNSVYMINGRFEPTPTGLQTTPAITEADALEAVRRHLGNDDISADSLELAYFTLPSGEMVLTYKVKVAPAILEAWTYFVNAADGSIVHRLSRIRQEIFQAQGSDLNQNIQNFQAWHQGNLYYMIDPSMPGPLTGADLDYVNYLQSPGNTYILTAGNRGSDAQGRLEFDPIFTFLPRWGWNQAGVSAMVNLRKVNNYLGSLGRNGIDDNGMNYIAVVDVAMDPPNAAWNGDIILLGNGDDTLFSNLAGGLDVMAHEMWHGVTQYEADLVYEYQSGALNEAFSDLFACMVDSDDWIVGEDVYVPSPHFLRNLADPTQGNAPLPTKMSEYIRLPNTEEGDFGGVHINMSIPSHAGYLMAEGLDIAIGREKTAQIWYEALKNYLSSSSIFADARMATIQAAEDLYGPSSQEVAVVTTAWDSVEVSEDTGDFRPDSTQEELAFSVQSLNFENVPVGTQSTREVILTNVGSRDVRIYDIFLSGSTSFSLSGADGDTLLAPNSQMVITLAYAPTEPGAQSATLIVTSDTYIPENHISITASAIAGDHQRVGGGSGNSGGCMINTLGNSQKDLDLISILRLGIVFGSFWLIGFCVKRDRFRHR